MIYSKFFYFFTNQIKYREYNIIINNSTVYHPYITVPFSDQNSSKYCTNPESALYDLLMPLIVYTAFVEESLSITLIRSSKSKVGLHGVTTCTVLHILFISSNNLEATTFFNS